MASLRAWIFQNHPRSRQYARLINAERADAFWIVGHNEGLILTWEVAKLSNRPVHLTLHDDIPRGVFGRSRRYRWLQGAAESMLRRACKIARSIDVASAGLQDYYRGRYGINCEVVLPYVPGSSMVRPEDVPPKNERDLVCGHIGSLYNLSQFIAFCRVFVQVAKKRNQRPLLLLIGIDVHSLTRLGEFAAHIESYSSLVEREAVKKLASCDFVYAMYPFGVKSTVFRRTSLPTKLSTYVQALRPIFAHTPADSTLAKAVIDYNVGTVCNTLVEVGMEHVLNALRGGRWERAAFEQLREEYYGFHNVRRMEEFLCASSRAILRTPSNQWSS